MLSKGENIVIWLTACGVVIGALSFAVYLHHEAEHGDLSISTIVGSALVLLAWVLTVIALTLNLRDAHRAQKLSDDLEGSKGG